jgi:hypothetical protein
VRPTTATGAGANSVAHGKPPASGERIENGTLLHVEAVTSDHLLQVRPAHAGAREDSFELDLRLLPGAGGFHDRTPSLRLAYAMHPNPAQGATVARTASLGHPIADRNASYVADTRAKSGHSLHLSREDLGETGTDADRLERLAAITSNTRSRDASVRYAKRARSRREPER